MFTTGCLTGKLQSVKTKEKNIKDIQSYETHIFNHNIIACRTGTACLGHKFRPKNLIMLSV